jgi:hypothetical protein
MSDDLGISSAPFFNPLSPRVHPCECGCIHEFEAFFLSCLVDSTFQRMDSWLYFPGVKVGQIHLYSSFVNINGNDCKSLDSTEYDYIPELGR